MFSVIDNNSQEAHGYADDTHFYRSFNLNYPEEQKPETQELQNCISNLRDWMFESKLKMNDGKTECVERDKYYPKYISLIFPSARSK